MPGVSVFVAKTEQEAKEKLLLVFHFLNLNIKSPQKRILIS